MTVEEVAENMTKIGSTKVTAVVLNAERLDHLVGMGQSQLS